MDFVWSNYYMIQHELDLLITLDEKSRLIPAGAMWKQFYDFLSKSIQIQDREVLGRNAYGEMRLTILKVLCKATSLQRHSWRVKNQCGD